MEFNKMYKKFIFNEHELLRKVNNLGSFFMLNPQKNIFTKFDINGIVKLSIIKNL